MRRLARWCYGYRRRVLAGWLLLAVALTVAGSALLDGYRMDVSLPGTEADAAGQILTRGGFGQRSRFTGQIVFFDPDGVDQGVPRNDAGALISAVRAEVPEVGVLSPFDEGGSAQVSADGDVAFAEIDFGDIELAEGAQRAVVFVGAGQDHRWCVDGVSPAAHAESHRHPERLAVGCLAMLPSHRHVVRAPAATMAESVMARPAAAWLALNVSAAATATTAG